MWQIKLTWFAHEMSVSITGVKNRKLTKIPVRANSMYFGIVFRETGL